VGAERRPENVAPDLRISASHAACTGTDIPRSTQQFQLVERHPCHAAAKLSLIAAVLLPGSFALAEPQPAPGPSLAVASPRRLPEDTRKPKGPSLSYDLRRDLPLVVASYAVWSTLRALHPVLASNHCRWCDDDLNAVDEGTRNALRWPARNYVTAKVLSDVGADGLAPAATVGVSAILAAYDDRFGDVPIDILVTAQAVSLAGVVTELVKLSTGRMRPDAHALQRRSGAGTDAYISFYSGHTSYAFSLAVAAGTIASLRQYRGAGWVWVSGLIVASATGYFRIAADKHYLSDVLLAGAGASLVGFTVPYFLHHPTRDLRLRPGVVARDQGALVTLDVLL
jgi:membrane-associated phospholipid phosphatase